MSNIVPSDRFNLMGRLRSEIDRLFDRWDPRKHGGNGGNGDDFWAPSFLVWGGPAVDVMDTEDEVIVAAELPGLEKDDFRVEISGNRLFLHGEKKSRSERKDGSHTYSESRYGAFHRAIELPADVYADKADASYKNGVLRLRLPKTEDSKARRIKVKVD